MRYLAPSRTGWLEPDGWGTRFPMLMNRLYQGQLDAEDAPGARIELSEARSELSRLPLSAVVRDIADLSARPLDGADIDPEIKDLSQYFLNNDGEGLFDVIDAALASAQAANAPITIRATDQTSVPELGLRVGANVWGIGDHSRVRAAVKALAKRAESGSALPRLLEQLADGGIQGTDLSQAQREIARLHAVSREEPHASLRTPDGRDLLVILDEALSYAARSGKPARIERVLS